MGGGGGGGGFHLNPIALRKAKIVYNGLSECNRVKTDLYCGDCFLPSLRGIWAFEIFSSRKTPNIYINLCNSAVRCL